MKALNLTLRIILLTFALVSTTAFAYDMKVNGICYNINGNEATVTYLDNSFPAGMTGPGRYNYYYKYNNHITIPETVTFNGLSYTVTNIGDYAFANCTSLKSVSIPKTVTNINLYAFYDCDALISIAIPNSVTSIGDDAFYDCDGLTSITIPDSVSFIGNDAFYSCNKMTNATIGSSVTFIGSGAFNYTPLSYITCLTETPPSLYSNYNYFNSYVNTTLYVPSNSIEAYQTATIWKNFKIITDFKPNYLSLDDVSTMRGDTIIIPVMMQNENDITAFQTDICLVDGFELVKNENDEYQVSLSDRKGRDHVILANETPDGTVRVASYSPTLKTYKNNEGELFYITVKVPENGAGVYPIILKNSRLTTVDEDEVLSPDAFCNVTVIPYIKGDANNSGDVTIADVVVTAMYILYQNPDPFNLEAADMNGDSKITITDAVKIANLILDQNYEEEPANLRGAATNMAGDRMSGDVQGKAVSINLENEQEYTALQMDLTLPKGMTASEFALTERASDLSLIVKDRGNGKVRVVGYTSSLKAIMGNEGAVLTFNVDGAMSDIVVDRIEVVTTSGESIRMAGFNIPVSNPTALNEMTADKAIANVKYFNLAGQQMTEPATGVTLVVTTYTDGTRTATKLIR